MRVERKPLSRPDVVHVHLADFALRGRVESCRPNLERWAELVASGRIDSFQEQEVLAVNRCTISREKHVQLDGNIAHR